jgi:hypothetical protein
VPDDEIKDGVWRCRDGREFRIEEMWRPHLGAARARLKRWLAGEKDPDKRKELKRWVGMFGRELRRREKEWKKRQA